MVDVTLSKEALEAAEAIIGHVPDTNGWGLTTHGLALALDAFAQQARDKVFSDVLAELSLRYADRSKAAEAAGLNTRLGAYLSARCREITELETFCRALKSPAKETSGE